MTIRDGTEKVEHSVFKFPKATHKCVKRGMPIRTKEQFLAWIHEEFSEEEKENAR